MKTQTPTHQWRIGAHYLIGRHHDRCQDAIHAEECANGTLRIAVADGVSGGVRGDVAAEAAVRHCCTGDDLISQLTSADQAVANAIAAVSHGQGATTLVGAWLNAAGTGTLFHLGDCRAYRYSPNEPRPSLRLQALTSDHSYRLLKIKPPPGLDPDNPAYMLGLGDTPRPATCPLTLGDDETLLLSTDGLHSALAPFAITYIIRRGLAEHQTLNQIAQTLNEQALAAGSEDDISALLIQRRRNS